MSSSRSDILPYGIDTPVRPWRATLLVNVPTIILIGLMFPLGRVLEENVDPYFLRIGILIGFNIILAVSLQLINGFSGQFSLGHAGFMAVGAYLAAYPAISYSNRLHDPGACLLFFFGLLVVVAIGGCVLLGIFLRIRATRKVHSSLPMVLLIALFVWVLLDFARSSSYADANSVPGFYIWSHGLDLVQRMFAWITGSGAGLASRASASLPEWLQQAISYLILVLGGGACAAVVGLVVGMPALR